MARTLHLALTALLLAPAASAFAQTRPLKVALLEIEARGVPTETVSAFGDALAAELGRRPEFDVLTQTELSALLDLQASQQMLGCEGDGCYSELGQLLDVDRLVRGSVAGLGEASFVNLALVDTRKALVVSRAAYQAPDGSAGLVGSAKSAVGDLLAIPAQVHLVGQVEGARVFIDGQLVGRLPMQPFPHRGTGEARVRVEHVDYPSFETTTQLAAGQTSRVTLDMKSFQDIDRSRRARRRWGLGTTTVAAGVLAVGGVLTARGYGLAGDLPETNDELRRVTQDELDADIATARNTLYGGYATLGVGAALLGAGIYLFASDPDAWRVEPTAGGGGGLTMRF